MLIRILLPLVMLAVAGQVSAHEVRPAFLQIREIEPSTYDVLWKTPAQGNMRLSLNVRLPSECRNISEPRMTLVNAAVVERWRTRCEGGLPNRQLTVQNLQTSLTDVILRFEPLTGSPKTLRMTASAPLVVVPPQQSTTGVVQTYFRLGIEHILSGFDHLLFVWCLMLLVNDRRRLLVAITSFTVAHSITLAGTTFGWLRLDAVAVEACIALSIAFVAAEIVKGREGKPSAMRRWPWIACCGFGLLHGFGFAAALREIGLPEDAVPLALLFFNLGVEAGQILFVAALMALMFAWHRYVPRPLGRLREVPPYIAGIVASFWFIERTVRIFV